MKGMLNMEIANFVRPGPADCLLAAMLIICIATDLKSRLIYNKVLLPFLIIGLGVNFHTGGWPMLLDSLKGFGLGLVMLLIPFSLGGIGGGDVKLLAVIGAVKGSSFVISTFLAGALAGGVLALIILVRRRRLLNTLLGIIESVSNKLIKYGIPWFHYNKRTARDDLPLHLPYSLAIGTGVAVSYGAGLQALLR